MTLSEREAFDEQLPLPLEPPAEEAPAKGAAPATPDAPPRTRRARSKTTKARKGRAAEHDALLGLREQGFTQLEAQRLIFLADHLAHSSEAREAAATLRRLRFARWMIEQGILDEFPA